MKFYASIDTWNTLDIQSKVIFAKISMNYADRVERKWFFEAIANWLVSVQKAGNETTRFPPWESRRKIYEVKLESQNDECSLSICMYVCIIGVV